MGHEFVPEWMLRPAKLISVLVDLELDDFRRSAKVTKLLEDVNRLRARVDKLDAHFSQAQDDVAQIKTSTDKISARGQKIEALEFEDGEAGARAELLRLQGRNLRAVE